MAVKVEIGIVCTPGPESGRPVVNQDNYLLCRDGKARFRKGENETIREAGDQGILLAVSDGLGKGRDGETAARVAVQSLPLLLDATWPPGSTPEEHLRLFLLSAHRRIRDAAKAVGPVHMGAALTVAWFLGSHVHWAHIGDTRLYHLRYRQLHQITRDHSLDEMAARKGGVGHPAGSALAQTFLGGGTQGQSEIELVSGLDTGTIDLVSGDQLVLMSDGIWRNTDEDLVVQELRRVPFPQKAAEALVAGAQKRGALDSATVIVARVT
jgi:protein phosphatase